MKNNPTPKTSSHALLAVTGLLLLAATPGFAQDLRSSLLEAPAKLRRTNLLELSLRQYVKNAAADSELRALLSKHNLTLEYSIEDLGLRFFLGVDHANIRGDFGAAPHDPELAFASNAATLQKFLLGFPGDLDIRMDIKMNFLRKLSLRKDMQTMRNALTRIYKATIAASAPQEVALVGQH